MASYSAKLCNYIITRQQNDLLLIFEKFSENVSYPEKNVFFLQNEVLEKVLKNIENNTKTTMTMNALFKGLDEEEKKLIASLNLPYKIAHSQYYCNILEISYFDQDVFMEVLTNELEKLATNYNLNANDDYNKLYMFMSSLKLTLQSSDELLSALANQYKFFNEHSIYIDNNNSDEFISIYGERHYKIDILKRILDEYRTKVNDEPKLTRKRERIR